MEAFAEAGEDSRVVHIKRLRRGNDLPFAIQSVYFLPEEIPGILDGQDLQHLFKLYQEGYGRSVANADERMQVRGASPEEAQLLDLEPDQPVLVRDRISYDQAGRVFEVLHSVDRGDRFVYRYQIFNDLSVIPNSPQDDSAS
jgi:GntR family transcriptional regulator